MRELINKLKEASASYYKGNPIMSDYEYDELYNSLVKMEMETGVIYKDSPTQNVGYEPIFDPVNKINKSIHDHLMLSLDKVHNVDEIVEFANHDVVAMYKADGLTVSATYIDGNLTKLETRGNGEVGNDILFHASSFENLPLKINRKGKYTIDGEAIIKTDDFERLREVNPEFKHPRNLAAGTLNNLDPNISKMRHLRFYAWDVIEGGNYTLLSKNLYEAQSLGFDVVAFYLVTKEDINNYSLKDLLVFMKKLAEEENFPIDGLVFKYNNIPYGKSLGTTGHHPKNAIAYKYEDMTYPTKIKNVEWTLGKTGVIVPTLVFEPVEIGGTTIERASLHNVSIFKKMNPTMEGIAFIYKANDVIPQVDRIESSGNESFEIPNTCPVCGGKTEVVKTENTEVLMCTNQLCKGKLLGKLNTFVSKKGFDIRGLSEQTLSKFIELGWVNSFIDIFNLKDHKQELMTFDGFGTTSVNKLLKAIEDSRHNVNPRNFLVSLSIPGIGEGQAKSIINAYGSVEKFFNALEHGAYINVNGIGDILNNNIFNWYENSYQDDNIDILLSIIDFETEMSRQTDNNLNGLTFVITGAVNRFKNRKELEGFINSHGGKTSGSVSKNTDYLINNDKMSASSKNNKAKELGIAIITEDEFMELVKERIK